MLSGATAPFQLQESGKAMLIGEYQHNIDVKGRIIVPAKFREDLGDKFYVTKGLDNCFTVRMGQASRENYGYAHEQG